MLIKYHFHNCTVKLVSAVTDDLLNLLELALCTSGYPFFFFPKFL